MDNYLKQEKDRGLVLNPNYYGCKVDAYPYANFSGIYVHEKPTYPTCVKSHTGFIIMIADCTVLWVSKLQTETTLLTMEAEIIEIAHCCRELFTIINIATSLGKAVGLPMGNTTINDYFHKDNAGALLLARTLTPQLTSPSNYYATKTIWFHKNIVNHRIKLLKIDTVEQLGDLFTKGPPRTIFNIRVRRLWVGKFLKLIQSILERAC